MVFSQTETGSNTALPSDANATVLYVVDGDTVVADVGGTEETVRLIGLDTPETVDPATEVECFGPEASRRMKELLPEGSFIRLVRDAEERDRYGRLLAYVYRATDGLFVNDSMLIDGYAEVLSIEPNTAFKSQFRDSQNRARGDNAGIWAAC